MAKLSKSALSAQCVVNRSFQAVCGMMVHKDQGREIGVTVLEVETSPQGHCLHRR